MIKSNSGIRKTDVINRRMFIIGAAKVVVFVGIVGPVGIAFDTGPLQNFVAFFNT